MKAWVCREYGGPENLELVDLPDPVPAADEVLVRVRAASLNALDWRCMRGEPFMVRGYVGWRRPSKMPVLGADIAGAVEAVGADVSAFNVGDRVFGEIGPRGVGGCSELALGAENELARIDDDVSFEDAASLPVAGVTAHQYLRDGARVKEGDEVLVNGAVGGVGSFAVQVAKAFGARVTAVCSTGKMDLARVLGADAVVDYTRQDCVDLDARFDAVFDTAAYRSIGDYRKIMEHDGVYLLVGGSNSSMFGAMLFGGLIFRGGQRAWTTTAKSNPEDLAWLMRRTAEGKIKPCIGARFPLEEVPEAMVGIDRGHATGKTVVTIGS